MGCFSCLKNGSVFVSWSQKTGWWGNSKWFSIRSSGSLKGPDYFLRRWQLTYIFFYPEPWGGEDSHFDEHTCLKGWFNHQLVSFLGGGGWVVFLLDVFLFLLGSVGFSASIGVGFFKKGSGKISYSPSKLTASLPLKNSLGGCNSNIFYLHPYLGKIPMLTSIFFRWVETTNQ